MSSDLYFQTGKFGSARVPRSRLAGMSSREIRIREGAEISPGLGVQSREIRIREGAEISLSLGVQRSCATQNM